MQGRFRMSSRAAFGRVDHLNEDTIHAWQSRVMARRCRALVLAFFLAGVEEQVLGRETLGGLRALQQVSHTSTQGEDEIAICCRIKKLQHTVFRNTRDINQPRLHSHLLRSSGYSEGTVSGEAAVRTG